MNVISTVVENDYCIGCGICAGICPNNNLIMDWSDRGEIIPYSIDSCKKSCSICLEICPFFDQEINQDHIANELFSKLDGVNYNEYVGYYLSCHVGYRINDKKRLNCASGGIATLLLSHLLEKNIVDKVVAVGCSAQENRMFDFKILATGEEVYSCAGSVYYPLEISKVLKRILREKNDNKYAIIALPCFCHGLRLVMEKIPRLRRKIKYIFSLTCGQLQNRYCTELLSVMSGVSVNELSGMDFRRKDENKSASDFSHVPIAEDGSEGKAHAYHDLPYYLWHYRYFTQNACNFCDDVFGEVADITFMDAWLPEFIEDYRGTSLIVVRNDEVKSILEKMEDSHLKSINVNKITDSQKSVIFKKTRILQGRLWKTEKNNKWHPKTRLNPDENCYKSHKRYIDLTTEIQHYSKIYWNRNRLNESPQKFWRNMKRLTFRIKIYELEGKIKKVVNIKFKSIKDFLGIL